MWLNYDNLQKLFMSIGVGLLVAAFVYTLASENFTYNYIKTLDEMADKNASVYSLPMMGYNKTYLQFKADYINYVSKRDNNLFNALIIGGIIFFIVGFIPFFTIKLPKEWREIKKGWREIRKNDLRKK